MLIIDPAKAASAIGAQCGGRQPGNDGQLAEVITLILPRIEAALNVESLVRGSFVDRFEIPRVPTRGSTKKVLRLRNGFIVTDSIVITDQNGEAVTAEHVDDRLGTITVRTYTGGDFSVAYDSGFLPSDPPPDPPPDDYDPEMRVLQAVPDFIKAIAVRYLVEWFRTTKLEAKVPDGVSLGALLDGIQRSIYSAVYGNYLRPRAGIIWNE